jgi:uncharacterized protein (TIGR00251 family)
VIEDQGGAAEKAALLDVKVIPRAGRSEVAGTRDNALLVRLAAAPVEGDANLELIDLLSHLLSVPKRHIVVVAGEKRRRKRVKVIGMSAAQVRERLGLAQP